MNSVSMLTLLPRIALGAVLGGGALALGVGHHCHVRAAGPPSLGSLWAQAIDGMIDVPGCEGISSPDGVLYMAPVKEDPPPMDWPMVFSTGVVFSVTGHNPMGVDAPAAANREANLRLEADVRKLRPIPRVWWRSFGFNIQEGWREDGFSLAYGTGEQALAKAAVLRLAQNYKQAAIYAYTHKNGVLFREIVWCDKEKREDNRNEHCDWERMVVVREPPNHVLASRRSVEN